LLRTEISAKPVKSCQTAMSKFAYKPLDRQKYGVSSRKRRIFGK
jgi:hypothetical protein